MPDKMMFARESEPRNYILCDRIKFYRQILVYNAKDIIIIHVADLVGNACNTETFTQMQVDLAPLIPRRHDSFLASNSITTHTPKYCSIIFLRLTLFPSLTWRVNMMRRNPALVISLRATSNSWSISTQDPNLIARVDSLGPSRRPSCPFPAFAFAALLRKERGDPGAVNEIASCGKQSSKEEV